MFDRFTFRILLFPILLLSYACGQTTVVGETPAGTVDGSNAAFALKNSPFGSVAVYKSGVRQQMGSDYSLSGNTILFLAPAVPQTGDVLVVDYAIQAPPSPGFQYTRSITINHTKIPNTDQANFPVLVSGVYPYLANVANGGHVQNASGYDLVFTSDPAGQNRLNWEVESYNPVTGAVNLWVQIPSASHSNDTVFYMSYGNAAVTSFEGQTNGTWDGNFQGVYHLPNGSSLSPKDSTANGNNGVNYGASATAGWIGGGASLSGARRYIGMGNVLDIGGGDATLSAWVKAANQSQATAFVSKRQNSSPYPQYEFGVGSLNSSGLYVSGKTLFCAFFDGTTLATGAQFYHTQNNIVDGNWHHFACTRNSSGVAIFVDGLSQTLIADIANPTEKNTANTGSFNIGYQNDASTYFVGTIDEVRISTVARSADWIAAEYSNQMSPSTFYTVGNEVVAMSLRRSQREDR